MSLRRCPLPDRLLGFALGTIDESEALTISKHLHECKECESRLDAFDASGDTLCEHLQTFADCEAPAYEPQCTAALRALELKFVNGGALPREGRHYDSGVGDRGAAPLTELHSDQDAHRDDRESTIPSNAADKRLPAEVDREAGQEQGLLEQRIAPPLRFGDYLVIEPIAEGGMGRVYKARHRLMDRVVALKTIADSRSTDAATIRYFEREIRLAAKLVHPNVVRSYDAGVADGTCYLVMEFVPGCTLSQLLKRNGRLAVSEACEYVRQAALGLAAAHETGVVHRDVKPGNLILGDDGVVKVLDMGVACVRAPTLGEVAQDGEQTLQAVFLGTADYMAPEQARDPREATDKSDVYGLGCTFYRLLTGEPVFAGATVSDRVAAHRERPAPSPRSLRNDVPLSVEELLGRMLAKLPAERPAMSEVAESLARLADRSKEPSTVGGPAGAGSIPPNRGRRFAAIAAAGAGAFLVLCGIWVYVKDRNGQTIAAVQVPDGGKAEFSTGAAPTSIPVPAIAATPKKDPTIICELLAAKRPPQGLAAGTIAFDGPNGDGRRGGNGILVTAPQGWQAVGTEWSFRYRRSAAADGLLIIHPFGEGHFRIVVMPTSLAIIRGGAWGSADVAVYGESGGESIELGKNIAAVWPLSDDRAYAVVSRCDAKGRYSLAIDGVEVTNTKVGQVLPQLMKPPFADPKCPETLAIGHSALILGPIDRGAHEAGEIRFNSSGTSKASK